MAEAVVPEVFGQLALGHYLILSAFLFAIGLQVPNHSMQYLQLIFLHQSQRKLLFHSSYEETIYSY